MKKLIVALALVLSLATVTLADVVIVSKTAGDRSTFVYNVSTGEQTVILGSEDTPVVITIPSDSDD